jgi:hypothetical protein
MALLLTLLTFGCYRAKPVAVDFGHGRVMLPKEFRFDPNRTEREPDAVRWYFSRVNDTHMNGQTSYAEVIVLSALSPRMDEALLRGHLNRGRYDAMPTKQPWSVEQVEGVEMQFSTAMYERDPVKEKAIVARLVDWKRRRVLGWYGYQKHWSLESARAYLLGVYRSLELDQADLDGRFEGYERWEGNEWMDAYFENQTGLVRGLAALELARPFQSFIGSGSSWESKGNWHVAIDGERPAYLHLVEEVAGPECDGIEKVSPDLRAGLKRALGDRQVCLRVYRENFWVKRDWEAWVKEKARR